MLVTINAGEKGQALLYGFGQLVLQLLDVANNLFDALVIELQRSGHIIKYAKVIHDQAMSLLLRVGPVHPTDRLQQSVVTQRLVQVHCLQDRCIEAGQ
ncbi:hypothetical protein D3C85_1304820 [compost metagenome]